MSHVVTIQTQVRDPTAIAAACQRLGLAPPVRGIVQLFSATAEGWAVELPGWKYPVVCDTASGSLKFDNFNGCWGEQKELDRFMQAYACEKAKLEARRHGHTVTEQPLGDGSIKLTIQVAGGVA
jgi:hypothetical protein